MSSHPGVAAGRTTICAMRPATLRSLVLLVALVVCALQLPLMAAAAMPDMPVSGPPATADAGHVAGQRAVEPCCALQAVPASAAIVLAVALAVLAVWLLTAWAPRPLPGLPPSGPVPVPGLRGRPFLHAYLN